MGISALFNGSNELKVLASEFRRDSMADMSKCTSVVCGNYLVGFRHISHRFLFSSAMHTRPTVPAAVTRGRDLHTAAMLPIEQFIQAVDATPLVAIDLIVPNENGSYLLGHRVNRPAQGFWFVPGGRIRKNERLDDAFRGIARDELGNACVERADADLVGVYEHLYVLAPM
ncbi:NUDIX domain-containing protein [Paraburkholderia sp. RL17-337-BIB-A]|uniref:NUDIX domain-containing protein n=1 Tax=Paraburkholderia sp. RL17-337-BIB-A TaxID=3031636 RepID=UPI0038B78255